MKTLQRDQLLTLLPADNAESERMATIFEQSAPLWFDRGEDGKLQRLVSSGRLTAEQICFNHQPAFLCWYHIEDGCLWVNAMQSYDAGINSDIGFMGLAALAKREGCSRIRYLTIRQGLARAGRKFGFKPLAVLMGTA